MEGHDFSSVRHTAILWAKYTGPMQPWRSRYLYSATCVTHCAAWTPIIRTVDSDVVVLAVLPTRQLPAEGEIPGNTPNASRRTMSGRCSFHRRTWRSKSKLWAAGWSTSTEHVNRAVLSPLGKDTVLPSSNEWGWLQTKGMYEPPLDNTATHIRILPRTDLWKNGYKKAALQGTGFCLYQCQNVCAWMNLWCHHDWFKTVNYHFKLHNIGIPCYCHF